MKNLFIAILVAFSLGTTSASFAAANHTSDKEQTALDVPTSVSLTQIVDSKLDVVVEKATGPNLSIRLSDAVGKIIATKKLSKNEAGNRVRFDLASLEDGVYHVKVSDGKKTQVKKFEIKTTVPAQATYQEVSFI